MFIVLELSVSRHAPLEAVLRNGGVVFGSYITESGKLARGCFCTIADPWKESETNKN